VPTTKHTRTIAAPAGEVWELIGDPHHLPRWWPRVARVELRALLGGGGVREDRAERVAHAAGRSYPDLVRLRAGEPEGAPDAVLYPTRPEQLPAILKLCVRHSIAVVPFGGGTSVVGGLAPLRGGHAAVLALDLRGTPGSSCRESIFGIVRVGGLAVEVASAVGVRAPRHDGRLKRFSCRLSRVRSSTRVPLDGEARAW
jgi:alkyldihydroxyacetonephosphate synthase